MLGGFQEVDMAAGADVLPRLLALAVFVAGVVEKRLNDPAGLILPAVPAGNVASGQAAFLLALWPAQIPGAVQIPWLAALAGFQILPAGSAVRTAVTVFLCTVHWGRSLQSRT